MNRISRYFLLIVLMLFSFTGFALSQEDFYGENGQVIKIDDPPFFDYPTKPHEDILMGPCPCYWIPTPQEIFNAAKKGLRHTLGSGRGFCAVPPPYYWNTFIREYRNGEWSKLHGWINRHFCRYSDEYTKQNDIQSFRSVRYSEYSKKYEYLFYWFDIACALEGERIRRILNRLHKEKDEAIEAGNEVEQRAKESLIDSFENRLNQLGNKKQKTLDILQKSIEEIRYLFRQLYTYWIHRNLSHPDLLYERGLIYFDEGDYPNFMADVSALLHSGNGDIDSPDLLNELGQAYNDANQYNQAIRILTQAIEKDPTNKEAYFRRAQAYFEMGNIDLALEDYIASEIHPTQVDPDNPLHAELMDIAKGLIQGCCQGGADSAVHFVPNLLSTVYGLGKGLWAIASNPVDVSKELVEGCKECIDYARANLSPELLEKMVPALRACIEKWDELDKETQGYYLGYLIGRFGVDILAFGGTVRGLKLISNLRKANTALTLESGFITQQNLQEIKIASEEYYAAREAFKNKCKLRIDKQNKHVPSAHNFKMGSSELTLPIEELEVLASKKIGAGIPQRHSSFGSENYRELVDFGKEIGIEVNRETKIRTPTTIGEIHYDKNGGYHIVPAHPNRFIE